MFKKITFRNGLRLLYVPQKNTDLVTILVLVKTGSKYEKKEENGISHFLEHMVFKGTKKRPSPLAISEPLDSIGSAYNAFTSQELTGYWVKAESKHFNFILEIVSDIFLNPLLQEEEIEKEKKVIEEEINMIYDNPTMYIDKLWFQLLYGDQPAGWPISGTKETVKAMTREKLLNYRNSQYVSKNTLVVVAGSVPFKDVLSKVKKYFGKIPNKDSRKKFEVKEIQKKPEILIHSRKTDQVHICLGFRTFNLFDKRRYQLEVLSRILGGMMSSRLFLKIREEMALCYFISTIAHMDLDSGFLVTEAGLNTENLEKAIKAILKEYKELREKEVSVKELKKAKENIVGKMILSLESLDAKASFYGVQELLEEKIETPQQIIKKIKEVTPRQLLNLAKDIFVPQRLNLAMITSGCEKEKIEKILTL